MSSTTTTFVTGQKYRVKIKPDSAIFVPNSRTNADDTYTAVKLPGATNWIVVWDGVETDGLPTDAPASEWGWKPDTHLMTAEIETLGMGTDWRGWFVGDDAVTVVDGTDPLTAQIDELTTTLAQVREELAQVRNKLWAAQTEAEDFRVRVSKAGAKAANDHDFCSVYDELAEELGLDPRVSDQEVEIEVTYRTTVLLQAHDYDDAEEIIRGASRRYRWEPVLPFEYDDATSTKPDSVEWSIV